MSRLFRALIFPCLLAAVLTLWLRWRARGSPGALALLLSRDARALR
jgi:hypothetical protein